MKKIALVTAVLFLLGSLNSYSQMKIASHSENDKKEKTKAMSIYDIKVKDIDGKEFSFSSLKGKKILIVNTASKCGYTKQYKELEELYKKYAANNFVIIGVPANNFGEQEPGTNKEIATFCSKNYGVTFPMMEKASVAGKDMSQLYQFLTIKKLNGVMDSTVEWNFQKYLIDEKGNLVAVFPPKTTPMSEEIVSAIQK